ncbi:MAG: DNA primase [Planctomycetaceae bacterium]|nr:DNA primase [Planctomycetaceae bacterium]
MIHDAKEQVRQATDIVELVGKYLDLRRQGRHFVGLCPWHNDRKPSLTVNQDRQTWKCWVCDIGGDVFSFVMQKEGCDFKEALQMLADRAGIQLAPSRQAKAEPGSPEDKNTLLACCEWAARQFHECLLKSDAAKEARSYLEERAITPFSVERFAIGFAPNNGTWLIERARSTPYSSKVLEAAGLVGQNDGRIYDFFRGRLLFPIRDTQGRPVSFAGRVLPSNTDPRAGKYINCRETRLYSKSDTLYALDIARTAAGKSRELIVVEGYTDVILAHQCGVGEAIACCGTAVTERHIRTLKRFADTIYLVLDGDEAGQRRTNEILELFVAAQVDLRIMTLPDELDPAEFMLERGGEAFRALLGTATDALEHKIRIATRGVDLVRDTHRANQALEDILATIARGTPPGSIDTAGLRAHQLLARLARQFQLDDGDLRTRFHQLRRSVKSRVEMPAAEESADPTYKLASLSPTEIELLEILDLQPTLAADALAEIADDDLSSAGAREILATYRRLEEAGQSLEFATVLGEIENASLKSLLVALDERAHEKSPKAILDGPTRLRSVIRQVRQLHEDRERRQAETALENKVFNAEEEHSVLLQMIANKRRQQGLIAPTER